MGACMAKVKDMAQGAGEGAKDTPTATADPTAAATAENTGQTAATNASGAVDTTTGAADTTPANVESAAGQRMEAAATDGHQAVGDIRDTVSPAGAGFPTDTAETAEQAGAVPVPAMTSAPIAMS